MQKQGKVKGWEMSYCINTNNQKKARVAELLLDRIGFSMSNYDQGQIGRLHNYKRIESLRR